LIQLPRFYPILDAASLERRGLPVIPAAEAMLAGGARLLQLRVKGEFGRAWLGVAEEVAALCREAGALFVLNDRADLARMIDEAGCHVGQEDLSPGAARRVLGAGRVLGFSTHNEAQLRAGDGEPVDYLALGPVFGTASKERADPVVGLAELRRLRGLTGKPLVAIGGITRAEAGEVLAAGADSVAVIGDVLPEAGGGFAELRRRVEEWVEVCQ
jgi:thiamine-phosphate pyrophosphorylase